MTKSVCRHEMPFSASKCLRHIPYELLVDNAKTPPGEVSAV
jgi:hypothetical protein